MELAIKDKNTSLSVSETIFGRDFNEPLVHQVVVAFSANTHQGTKAQKSRSDVTGSGKKPHRQKGTGRARAGSVKSPIWRSGGVTFAAKPQNHEHKVNKKMYRGAMKSIFSELVRQKRLILVDEFLVTAPKTKLFLEKIKALVNQDSFAESESALIIVEKIDKNLYLAARNPYKFEVREVETIDPVILISFDKVIITTEAIKKVEEVFA